MRWRGRRGSENVEDRRGNRIPGGGLAVGGGGAILLVLLGLFFGFDPRPLLEVGGGGGQGGPQEEAPIPGPKDDLSQFVSVVLADTEEVWGNLLRAQGQAYREPKLVLFKEAAQSACGFAQSAMGPFYCPPDEKLYIDLSFYEDLRRRHGAPGDFAQAYVIAHEVGHHVQNLLGISDKVQAARGRMSETEYNQLSVRLELQADFFAGVWAHHAQREFQILEEGDIEEALQAASAIGDDRLQKEARGHVTPDSFTHGTSAQRVRWFRRGFESGDPSQGDTFRATSL
jgi:uncharacterized protein